MPTTARFGIDEVHGEVRPQDKLDLVARLQSEGRLVAMLATASTMRRHSRLRTSALRWKRGPTWR